MTNRQALNIQVSKRIPTKMVYSGSFFSGRLKANGDRILIGVIGTNVIHFHEDEVGVLYDFNPNEPAPDSLPILRPRQF